MELQRDVFINVIFEAAKKDKDILFLTADLGAKALDRFREELPKQVIHVGISEQNMIDLAAGLSQCGKKVFCYAMAPFATLRCFEQIRVMLGAMKQPVTIIGVGVGYGYDDAGPTHYATEDLACMRTIAGMEIYTPSDNGQVEDIAYQSLLKPTLKYVRLDRAALPLVEYSDNPDATILILASGYMVQIASKMLGRFGPLLNMKEIVRIKPFPSEILNELIRYDKIITLEEHFLSGGFGSAVLEALNDAGIYKPVLRIGSRHHYYFENGGREHIHKLAGIDEETIYQKISEFLA